MICYIPKQKITTCNHKILTILEENYWKQGCDPIIFRMYPLPNNNICPMTYLTCTVITHKRATRAQRNLLQNLPKDNSSSIVSVKQPWHLVVQTPMQRLLGSTGMFLTSILRPKNICIICILPTLLNLISIFLMKSAMEIFHLNPSRKLFSNESVIHSPNYKKD